MCPTCHTTLDQSDSPAARQHERVHPQRIAAARHDEPDRVRARRTTSATACSRRRRASGFDLLAWWLPLGGIARRGRRRSRFGVWRWSRGREPEAEAAAGPPLDPELERRLDDELLARLD